MTKTRFVLVPIALLLLSVADGGVRGVANAVLYDSKGKLQQYPPFSLAFSQAEKLRGVEDLKLCEEKGQNLRIRGGGESGGGGGKAESVEDEIQKAMRLLQKAGARGKLARRGVQGSGDEGGTEQGQSRSSEGGGTQSSAQRL